MRGKLPSLLGAWDWALIYKSFTNIRKSKQFSAMALLPPFPSLFDSMNWRRQKSKGSAVCFFGACPIEKTISLSFMPWHHQPPINTEKVGQVLSTKPTTAIVKLQKAVQVGGSFLLPCFCVKLHKWEAGVGERSFYGTNIDSPKLPGCKHQAIQVLYLCPIPRHLPLCREWQQQQLLFWEALTGIRPVLPAKDTVLGKLFQSSEGSRE